MAIVFSRLLVYPAFFPTFSRTKYRHFWHGNQGNPYEYDLRTVRQPGAEFAPLRFVCGALFSADIQNIYQRLPMPVWMARGIKAEFNDYRHEWIVSRLPNWSFSRFSTGAFPHFEALDYFCEDYDRWIDDVVAPRHRHSGPPDRTERRFK